MPTWQQVLGHAPGNTEENIRKKYKKLAITHHPDKMIRTGMSKNEANRKFKELTDAFEQAKRHYAGNHTPTDIKAMESRMVPVHIPSAILSQLRIPVEEMAKHGYTVHTYRYDETYYVIVHQKPNRAPIARILHGPGQHRDMHLIDTFQKYGYTVSTEWYK